MDTPVTSTTTILPEPTQLGLDDDLSPSQRDMLLRMGIALVTLWSELPRDIQRVLFEAATGHSPTTDAGVREKVARFLHDNKPPQTSS